MTLFIGAGAGQASIIGYSIDLASPSVPGVNNSDMLTIGPIGGPPTVFSPASANFLLGGTSDEVDGGTWGGAVTGMLFFSVDRSAVGLAGTGVSVESGVGQAAGDIFLTTMAGTNALYLNQDVLGELPAILAGTPNGAPIDNLDGLDVDQPGAFPTGMTLASGNIYGVSGADILAPGSPSPVTIVSAALLGLVAADDIDAHHFDSFAGLHYFSLVPGSASMGGGSPADIFVSDGTSGTFALFASAASLGLAATDNVDALAFSPIPEPATLFLLGSGLVGLAGLGRRRKRH